MLEISEQEREFELARIEFRAKMRLREYRREYTPPKQRVIPGQSLAAYNADHLLRIYGGSDPEAALGTLLHLSQSYGVPRDSLDRFLAAGYVPQPKQLLFHAAARACDRATGPTRIGFGGARGGAKSHSSLAQVVIDDCQREPGLKFLFLRKVLKKAKESFEDLRRHVLMGVEHTYKGNELKLPNGSFGILGHYGSSKDIENYLGLEYDVLVIEEVTQLPDASIRDIETVIRTSKPNWRPRKYYTTNPGGIGHESFKKEFIDPYRTHTETDTRFIFANHEDNVFLNNDYVKVLDRLTGWKKRAWKDGDWDIAAGQYFSTWSYPDIVKKDIVIMPGSMVWCSLDYGFTHPTSCHLFAYYDGKYQVIDEHWRQKALVSQNAEDIKNMLARHNLTVDHLAMFVAGPDVFARRGNDAQTTIADEYLIHGIELKPATTDRINGAGEILKLLGNPQNPPNADGTGGPIEPMLEIHERCRKLIECIPRMQHNPNRPEDVLKVNVDENGEGGDDAYDDFRYGVATPLPASGGGLAMGSAGGWGYDRKV